MKKLTLLFISLLFIFSCSSRSTFNPNDPNVVYSEAHNYYMGKMDNEEVISKKITSFKEFSSLFAMEAKIGKDGYALSDGKPTQIDFSKNNVVALIAPQSFKNKEIVVNNIVKDQGNIIVRYSIKDKTVTSTTSHFNPFKILIIDKRYDGNISLNKL